MICLPSRTSVTVDEAIAMLLGRISGPVIFREDNESSDEENDAIASLMYDLKEDLEEERDYQVSKLAEAKWDKAPDEEVGAIRKYVIQLEAEIAQATTYLCAINDELNKGESSALRIDTALSNAAYTYITLGSLNEWAKGFGKGVLADKSGERGEPGAIEPKVEQRTRTRLREQENAILAMIRELDYDPKALPKNEPGRPGVKNKVFEKLQKHPLFNAKTALKKAWDRLRSDNELIDMD